LEFYLFYRFFKPALTGKQEAEAFEQSNYLKLHMSTMRKVEIIDRILVELIKNSIKTKSKITEIYGLSIQGIISLVKDSPILILIWSIIIFVIGAAAEPIIQNIFGTAK
jgi:hypothetical protein